MLTINWPKGVLVATGFVLALSAWPCSELAMTHMDEYTAKVRVGGCPEVCVTLGKNVDCYRETPDCTAPGTPLGANCIVCTDTWAAEECVSAASGTCTWNTQHTCGAGLSGGYYNGTCVSNMMGTYCKTTTRIDYLCPYAVGQCT